MMGFVSSLPVVNTTVFFISAGVLPRSHTPYGNQNLGIITHMLLRKRVRQGKRWSLSPPGNAANSTNIYCVKFLTCWDYP